MNDFGVLCPLFSLPSRHGIGTVGAAAYKFVDLLAQIGASIWQVLPLGPTGYGDSPYQAFSAYAVSPYYIDLDALVESGVLDESEIKDAKLFRDSGRVDYAALYAHRGSILALACERTYALGQGEAVDTWACQNAWVEEYATFVALKKHFQGATWMSWAPWARERVGQEYQNFLRQSALARRLERWQQYVFDSQWNELRRYALNKGVRFMGDMSIYVAGDSCDVWANPEYFQLQAGVPTAVAGVPPDYFSATGQLWGNPLYNWETMKAHKYDWWTSRMARALKQYDSVRIDHFRGFSAYFAIPYGAEDARGGHWKKGVGKELFVAMERTLGKLPIIAEDLGTLDEDVYQLLSALQYPGMKVLQFAFDGNPDNPYLPVAHIPNSVVYTGTHDNETLVEWASKLTLQARKRVRVTLGAPMRAGIVPLMIRTALASVADTVIVPIQDLLKKGAEARINTPSSLSNLNWSWRMTSIPSERFARSWAKKINKAKHK